MYRNCTLFILVLFALQVSAQTSSTLIGARSSALGYTSSCLGDEWSIFNNPAGISDVKNAIAAVSYHAFPKIKSFNRMAAAFNVPTKYGVSAIGVFRFGDDLYKEEVISAAFSNRFGLASLGVKINYIQYSAEGFGSAGVVTVSFGGIAHLTDNLMIGAHITNINQPKITSIDREETVPTILTAGLAFKASDHVLLCSEVEKDLTREVVWRSGVEYQFNNKFAFRTGFNIHPEAAFAGLGFNARRLRLDYALEYNFNLGMSHQASIAYKFSSK